MAKKKFLVNIDLNLNQLINSRAENGTGFTTGGVNSKGRLMYDTSTNRVLYDTGVAIETIANLNDVTGLLDFHGGYNALTNTPNLVNPPSGTTFKGDFYIVTVAGTFYGTALEVGDSLFASVDNPTTLSGWVIVQGNVAYATETIAGIILLATQTEVNTGTNNSKAVTPLTLATYVADTRQNIYNTDGTLSANRTVNLSNKDLNFIGSGTSTYNYKVDNGVQTSEIYLDANQVTLNLNNSTLSLHSQIKVVNGTLSFKVYNDALTINRSLTVTQYGTRINSAYYLPNVDGTSGQVITTDGSGNLSWGNTSSLNIYNGNGTLTSDRTVTLGDKNLYFVGTGADQVFQTQQTSGSKNSINQQFVGEINQQVEDGSDYSNRQQNAHSIYQRIEGSNGVGSVYTTLQQLNSAYLLSVNDNGLSTSQTSLFNILSDTAQLLIVTSGVTNQVLEILAQFNQIVFSISSDDISNPFDTNLAIRPEGVVINSAYTLPKVDGTSGQVLTTNGSGITSFQTFKTIYNSDARILGDRVVSLNGYTLTFRGSFGVGGVILEQEDGISGELSTIKNLPTSNLIRSGNPNLALNSQILVDFFSITNSVSNDSNSSVISQNAYNTSTIIYDTFGTNIAFRLSVGASGLNINNAYTFPKVDGTNNQVLSTNGAGALSWQTISSAGSVNIYNTDGSLTANRTVTINDRSLVFSGNEFSTYRVSLTEISTDRFSYIDETLTRILSQVGNNNFTTYNSVDIDSGSVTMSSVNTAQSGTVSVIPTTVSQIVQANTQSCRTDLTLSGFRINSVYTLPKVDGTSGQVLTTNGSGTVSWQTGTTVNIYNNDGTLTGNRVVSLSTNNLTFNGSGGTTLIKQTNTSSGKFASFTNNQDLNLLRISNTAVTIFSDINQSQTNLNQTVQNTNTACVVNQGADSVITTIYDTNVTNVAFRLDVLTTGLKINNAYTFPKVDGTAGQVLTTNGAGVVTWGAGSSGSTNIYNSDGTISADRTISGNAKIITWNNVRRETHNIVPVLNDTVGFTINVAVGLLLPATTTRMFKIVDSSTTLERFGINTSGNVVINNSYALPLTDGTTGQVLTTDGGGNVSWATSGIGTTDIWKSNPNETYRGVSFNNNSTTVVSDGGVVLSVSASTLAQSVANTNFATKQVRLRYYASVVSAGRYTGLRGTALLWFVGGGFRYVCDFNISDTAYASGCQQFYGVASSIADLGYAGVSGVQLSTLFNIFGVGNDTNDANLQIFSNDGTGTATKIDLGASFPANRTSGAISTTVYEVQLLNLPASASIQYRVINKETGAIATGTVTTNLPDPTLGLNFFASRCMSTIGSVTNTGQFDCSKLGVYSML